MPRYQSQRKDCRDVFNAFLVKDAYFAGPFEFPVLNPTYWVPNRLVSFSKAVATADYNQWVHFYEDDYLFERVWRNTKRYLPILRRFNGVLLPDFSLYRDMPFNMQTNNIYRSRAMGFWLQQNGVRIIPNVRFADRRTYRCCCDGLSQGITIAIGTHGVMRRPADKAITAEGLGKVVDRLRPWAIVVYGTAPEDVFSKYRDMGVKIMTFSGSYGASQSEVA